MSSFFIWSIAFMTFSDFFASLSCTISPKILGTICHETPNLSFNQPHCSSSPPSESFSHKSSTSSCVSQFTKNDMAGENLKTGPPFNAMNCCPSSSNVTVITVPSSLPEASRSEEHTSELQSRGHL